MKPLFGIAVKPVVDWRDLPSSWESSITFVVSYSRSAIRCLEGISSIGSNIIRYPFAFEVNEASAFGTEGIACIGIQYYLWGNQLVCGARVVSH